MRCALWRSAEDVGSKQLPGLSISFMPKGSLLGPAPASLSVSVSLSVSLTRWFCDVLRVALARR